MTQTKQTQTKKKKPKYGPPRYKVGDELFLTAFLKKEQGKFYVCKAVVEKAPEVGERRVYKVKIFAVADSAINQDSTQKQASLLGRLITKRENELNNKIPSFMMPESWITKEI